MISHRHRCIFVHQRKAAGTSVKALFAEAGLEPGDRGRFNDGVLDPDWREDDPVIAGYLKFTVVRNPYERFVSAWKYCPSTRGRSIHDVLRFPPRENMLENLVTREPASLATRAAYARTLWRSVRARAKHDVKTWLGRADPARRRPSDSGHDYRHLTRPQWPLIFYPDGRLAVDVVIWFEELAEGIAALADRIGLAGAELPRLKVNAGRDDYRRHFDDRARALFEEIYAEELARFPYDFETGRRRA